MKLNFMLGNDIISIISLFYVIVLAKANMVVGGGKNKFYIGACITNILAIAFEILSRYISTLRGENAIFIHNLICNLHFMIVPVIPLLLIFTNYDGKNKLYNHLLITPLILNFIACFAGSFNGWFFFIDKNNQYARGYLFIVSVAVGILYFIALILFVSNIYNISGKNTKYYGKNERVFLLSIFFIIVLSCVVQTIFNNIYIIWSSVALALVLYYIFLRELQINYDCITGIRNRFAYENDLKKHKSCENDAIVMFDLNNLKLINDHNGHCNGDKVISASAQIIRDSFKDVGVPYRIGGDEFCVICRNVSKKMIENSLLLLIKGLDEINKTSKIKIGLAFGYSFFDDEFKSIYDVIESADKAMYQHKAMLKNEIDEVLSR